MKSSIKILVFSLLVALCFGTVSAEPNVDSISSASPNYYSNEAVIKDTNGNSYTAAERQIYPFWAEGSEMLKKAMSSGYDVVAPTVATTNEDGSPNIAVYSFKPVVGTDYKYVSFNGGGYGPVKSNTYANLRDRKLGVIMYYLHRPEFYPRTAAFATAYSNSTEATQKGFKYLRNQGARVIVKLVEDETLVESLKMLNNDTGNLNLYLEVVKVYPMG